MTETNLLQSIRLACSTRTTKLFRNNNGKLQDKTGRWVTFGLFPGSGDLIGWKSVVVTPDMVGQRIAQFVSLEVKAPRGHSTEDQINWRESAKAAGGIAAEVRSPDDALAALNCHSQVLSPVAESKGESGDSDANNRHRTP